MRKKLQKQWFADICQNSCSESLFNKVTGLKTSKKRLQQRCHEKETAEGVPKNVTNFTEKYLCWSLFLIKYRLEDLHLY